MMICGSAAKAGRCAPGLPMTESVPCGVVEERHRGFGALRAGAQGDVQAERREPAFAIEVMLLGEDLRGRHERGLRAGLDAKQHRGEGDQCFAGADVAVQQAVHRARRGEVGADFGDGAGLRAGKRERESGVETLHERAGAAMVPPGTRDGSRRVSRR